MRAGPLHGAERQTRWRLMTETAWSASMKGRGSESGHRQGYLEDAERHPSGSRIALAHRRVDVRALNEAIRSARQESGELPMERKPASGASRPMAASAPLLRAIAWCSSRTTATFRSKTACSARCARSVRAVSWLRSTARQGWQGGIVSVPTDSYRAIDHGYATTIHKTQGATVDKAFVLASKTMDRHLAYVAMTRHRQGVELHASREEFKDGWRGCRDRYPRDGARKSRSITRSATLPRGGASVFPKPSGVWSPKRSRRSACPSRLRRAHGAGGCRREGRR